MPTRPFHLQVTSAAETAIAALARLSALPKGRLKDALQKGAVWHKRGSKTRRLRRATFVLLPGDTLSLYYNPEVLALVPPVATLVADERQYSVWHKPAGLLAQGSREGDHCALLRQAELALQRDVFLVHRLDREAAGLMLIAHTTKAAAALSALFAREQPDARIRKLYRIEVRGKPLERGEIALPLDGKTALSRYRRLDHDPDRDSSVVEVALVTGRKHQIRRHFAAIGHPVLGDPLYGSNNKDPRGLQLVAMALEFVCPLTGTARHYSC
jgi:tRNA pseudouridine32 synthase/23S rRNA pseudouridine746 synthase